MAIAFGTAGTAAVGTTSLAVPHPASIAAGDMLVLVIANKYPTNGPSTPAGWSTFITNAQQSGGSGTAGIDVGSVYVTVFTKEAVGGETGNLTVTVTSGNASIGRMFRYTKGASMVWNLAACGGADNTAGTAWSVTGNANPGITAGDMVLACSAINTDGYTYSAQAIAATGITAWGTVTERQDSGTTQGQDCGMVVSEHPVTTGTASAAPVFTMTASSTATNNPAGATVMLRLREEAGPQTITLPSIDSGAAPGTIALVPVQVITLPSIDSGAAVGDLSLEQNLVLPGIDSGAAPGTIALAAEQSITLPSIDSGAVPGTISLSIPSSNPIVGYGKNSGGYSSLACYGVVPDIPLYHHPSENAQEGMILVGKPLYTDAAGTTPISAASTWWSFNKTGVAANRAMQIDGSGNVINVQFQSGVVFGYAAQSGNCDSVSGFESIYNAADDYQFWYPRKATSRSSSVAVLMQVAIYALSYANNGGVIGTASFVMINNFQHTYTTMTSCAAPAKPPAMFLLWE